MAMRADLRWLAGGLQSLVVAAKPWVSLDGRERRHIERVAELSVTERRQAGVIGTTESRLTGPGDASHVGGQGAGRP